MRADLDEQRRAGRQRPRAHQARGGALALILLLVASACSSGAEPAPTRSERPGPEAATVMAWARTDLGFEDAADCMARYLVGLELEGATRADLQRHGLDALPFGARQRVGDALVVCGIRETDR